MENDTTAAGDYRSIEDSDPRKPVSNDRAKLIGAVKGMGPKARAVVVIVDYDAGEAEYAIQEAGPDLDEWDKILGVLSAGVAYVQSEMFTLEPREATNGDGE